MSRSGLVLCLTYVAFTIWCIASALLSSDVKSRFVLLQLPIAAQGALLDAIGLGQLLHSLTWLSAYALLALPTAVLLYVFGKQAGRLIAKWLPL